MAFWKSGTRNELMFFGYEHSLSHESLKRIRFEVHFHQPWTLGRRQWTILYPSPFPQFYYSEVLNFTCLQFKQQHRSHDVKSMSTHRTGIHI